MVFTDYRPTDMNLSPQAGEDCKAMDVVLVERAPGSG